ncbi:hypothetical protein ACFL5X_00505 [Candidatus Omnitrophota bacterium]
MPSTEAKPYKRNPTICDSCGTHMVFADEVLKSIDGRGTYLKYVCPRRTGEKGCGKTKRVLFERNPSDRLKRIEANSFIPA